MSEYYKTLGLEKNASEAQIKSSYRKLAMKHHPDKNPGDKQSEETFKKISEAYAVLSDPEKKRQYDSYGDSRFHQQYSQEDIFKGADFHNIFGDAGFDANDIFSRLFGGGFGGRQTRGGGFGGPPKGQDVEYSATVAFTDALKGTERTINYSLPDGTKQSFTVKIPGGTKHGSKLRLKGKGMPSQYQAGPPGDLYIEILVAEHPHFKRVEDDIEGKLVLKLSEALLGCSKEVETPDGVKKLRVPAGVKPGTKLRLRSLGFQRNLSQSERGDFFAVIEYDVPNTLTPPQHDLIQSLASVGL